MSDRKKDKPSVPTEGQSLQANGPAGTHATTMIADDGERVKNEERADQIATILARAYSFILSPEWGK